MSAIGAIFALDNVPASDVTTMLASLCELPHDSSAQWSSDRMALVACTLHTTAESREQDQPCTSEDGRLAVVFNGYLQNPCELAEDLTARGVRLRNLSDVEIALHAYDAWGDDCAERMLGEFSLIVADCRRGRLFAAQDHLGFVPLYYKMEPGRLILASDFRAIAALSNDPLQPNLVYLAQLISSRWYLREDTPWQGVRRVVRAHSLRFDGERLEARRYWVPPTDITIRYKSDAEYAEHYREVLFDSVRRTLRSDGQIGIAVSGGLDSSALFAVADSLERSGQSLAPGIAGYTLAASPDGNAYEVPYARAVAEFLGRKLTEVPLFDPDIDWYTADARWNNDIAMASNGAMMLSMEQKAVDDGSRVFINGIGGDEGLQGNSRFYGEYLNEWDLHGFWIQLKAEIDAFGVLPAASDCVRQSLSQLAPDIMRRPLRKHLREKRRREDRALSWLAPELRSALAQAEEEFEASLPENAVRWTKHNIATSPFGDHSRSNMWRQRSRIGLESRHPMLSRSFVEFSLGTPAHIKRRGKVTKLVHRKAIKDLLPEKVLNRTTKANFTNTKIDAQYADYVRNAPRELLGQVCDLQGLEWLLAIDFEQPEGDYWAWEIWGLYASAAFLYQSRRAVKFNPATGVQQDRN